MTVSERIELLKSRILHYTQDLLEFDTVEIRLLDHPSRRLEPLLAVGMQSDAESRTLYAEPTGNGVTGFVAATGKSYLCEDTEQDPLYLPGAAGARSSLTVPLVFHDEILGTFNVESPRVGAFTENDLQFLELFSREIAVSLNTLELLVAEKMTTASESIESILREVAGPVDEILNDAAWVLEKYIGHEPTVCDRLNRVLRGARDIKQLIQRVGEDMQSKGPRGAVPLRQERPKLKDKRILVVDSDESVRRAAHALLGRFGCEVETAHDGDEALLMARSFHYDAVLVDIRLPDMNGYDCFVKLREIHEHLEIILMTGFGYDPSHSIVKARQAGLKSVLYKPFRLDQLLNEVEKAVSPPDDAAHGSA
jgi:CheY-like chemotaxis protein